eukprot:sb/3463364/
MSKPCRCDSKPCASGCPCFKTKIMCTDNCHRKVPWENVPCLNTDVGLKVKGLKPAEIRKALCDAGLSPVGDKGELQKRLAIHFTKTAESSTSGSVGEKDSGGQPAADNREDLMNAILENEGDFAFVLSLSGKIVKATSGKAELRKAYFLLSSKVHPDKNANSVTSKKAFQVVLEAFERLANPEKFDEDDQDDDEAGTRKRRKTERFTRDNKGCRVTTICCPRCGDRWETNSQGLEEAAYNFLMQGIKQYICGGCFLKFGCMTAKHSCPHCRKSFEYDPDDYHRKITCGNGKCEKEFGFWMFKVSEKREREVRQEVKEENEAIARKRAQQRRRGARAEKRVGNVSNEDRVKEQLFALLLLDTCPRCGWEIERGLKSDDAKEHLAGCNDAKAHSVYKAKQAKERASKDAKTKAVETQEETQAYKTWEYNGRQVGQLWMLGEGTLVKECKKHGLETEGPKHVLISRLGQVIRSMERRAITAGGEEAGSGLHDITPIHKVDEEDLPQNMDAMTRDELQCVAASYGLKYDEKCDVKVDLLKKLQSARLKGSGLLMILDGDADGGGKKRKRKQEDEEDSDFKLDE